MITNLFCSGWALRSSFLGFEKFYYEKIRNILIFFVFAENNFSSKKWIGDKNEYCSNLSDFRILATKYILNKNFLLNDLIGNKSSATGFLTITQNLNLSNHSKYG